MIIMKNNMKYLTKTLLVAGVLALVAGCGNVQKKDQGENAAAPVQATKVSVVSAVMQDVPQTETYASSVEAYAVNNIVPQGGSRIQKMYVDVGDFVSRGQVLAVMDRLNLEQSRMKLVNDSTEYARIKGLFEAGGVSQSDFEAVELGYKVSRTTYENLLENTVLRAPISGVITARNYDRGDMYAMAQPIYVLQQVTPVKILVGVSESDYTSVRKGQEVSITADAFPGRTFSGTVNRLYPTMDPTSHTFKVEVLVRNADRALRPGMFVKAAISFGMRRSIVLPDVAVVKQLGSGQRAVYILNGDGTVRSSIVELGRHFDTSYEILSGVAEGDRVAVRGSSNLRDGSKVEVVE